MRNYTFIIASISDVGNIQLSALIDMYFAGNPVVKGFNFSVPTQCNDTIIALVGKGMAFDLGYNCSNTISMIISAN